MVPDLTAENLAAHSKVNALDNDGLYCDCDDKQACHRCPESKKLRFLGKPPGKLTPPQRNPNGVPSRREAKRMRREVQATLSRSLGRRVTNAEMDHLVAVKAHEVQVNRMKGIALAEKQFDHQLAEKATKAK